MGDIHRIGVSIREHWLLSRSIFWLMIVAFLSVLTLIPVACFTLIRWLLR